MSVGRLKSRNAVVTGGAQGIGFAVAQRLLDEGARVALWDIDAQTLAQAKSQLRAEVPVSTQTVDITSLEQVEAAAAASAQALGSIDILVNSAGIAGMNAPVASYPADEWRRVMDINLLGTFHVNQAVVKRMIAQDYGRIVNIASIAYSASKAGVIALTKSLGKETAKNNIAVNAITPAAARTKIFDQMLQEHIDYMLSKIPRGRFVLVEEIAAMVSWLVSEENSFTTGAVFDLSGGRATY
jgi:3-oxoacyl-[acyl-carrier protein] reductase